MYGYIYLTTNLLNNKKYIGRHKSSYFDLSYKGSGKVITQAFKKDGWDNFDCKILCECNSEEEIYEKEAYYIDLYNAVESNEYYNLVPGGLGKSEKGKIFVCKNTEQKTIYPFELDFYLNLGYRKGRLPRDSRAIETTRIKNMGKKRTQATKDRISKALIGKKVSEETKFKLHQVHLGKQTYSKGKIMVYNPLNNIQKYILPEELNSYLNKGYEKRGKPKHKNFSKLVSDTKKGTIIINNGVVQKYIKPNDFEKYSKEGFIKGKLLCYCKNKYK